MAVTHDSNTLVIDGVMADLLSVVDPTFRLPIRINRIYWYNPSGVIGDLFVIENANAFTILPGRVEVDGKSQWFPYIPGKRIGDLKVSTLVSGVLYIEFDRKAD